MKIAVLPKYALGIVLPMHKGNPGAAICITAPNDAHGNLHEGWQESRILRLEFDDVDHVFEYKRPIILFNPQHAHRILTHILSIDPLWVVVSCDAGVSRSAGVAVALEEIFNGNKMAYKKYEAHNRHVCRVLLETWYEFFEGGT